MATIVVLSSLNRTACHIDGITINGMTIQHLDHG